MSCSCKAKHYSKVSCSALTTRICCTAILYAVKSDDDSHCHLPATRLELSFHFLGPRSLGQTTSSSSLSSRPNHLIVSTTEKYSGRRHFVNVIELFASFRLWIFVREFKLIFMLNRMWFGKSTLKATLPPSAILEIKIK